MGRFQTLLFDADNTLFDFNACESEALRLSFEKQGYPLDEEIYKIYDRINHDLWRKYELGLMDRETVIYSRFGLLFQKIGIKDDGIAFEDIYQELLGMQHFYMDGAEELVKQIYQSYDLYIVTNGVTRTQLRRFKDSKLDQYVKKIFVSEETGYQKPKKEYFDYCFERIENYDASKAIIIGDSLSSDIKGGNNVGIATCWFNPHQQINQTDVKVDYEIRHLKEFHQILES